MKMTNILNWINSKNEKNNNQIDPLAMLDWEIKSQEWNLVDDYKKHLEEYQKKITPKFIEKKKKVNESWKVLEKFYSDIIQDDFFQYFLSIDRGKVFEEYPEMYLIIYNKYLLSLIKEAIVMTNPILDVSEREFKEKIKSKIYSKIIDKSWFNNGSYYKTRTLNSKSSIKNNPNMWIYKNRTDRLYFLEETNFLLKDLKILWEKDIVNIIINYLKPYLPILDNMEEIQSKLFERVWSYFTDDEYDKEYYRKKSREYDKEKWIIVIWEFKLKPEYWNLIDTDEHFLKDFNNIISFLKTFSSNNKVNNNIFNNIKDYIKNDTNKTLQWQKNLIIWKQFLDNINIWDIFEEIRMIWKQDKDSFNKTSRKITIKAKVSSKIRSKLDKRVKELQELKKLKKEQH